ncbi:RNA polymerase sigma24 factor [Knoellia sinensis KCTC 19936]|uniref:RNA polymerase sigma24 factor n=1 Tax=Knoellia sinensis KCTC 19936 TaxID=1385520 RepID=A0A0A0JAU0_9MICO|nr:SigE family RNA polymerase sigma factor [Knoellia sinensis]KGN34268.1 RNA polymerase sigma24 factor [Knoellia sinensis KCTC 19936]
MGPDEFDRLYHAAAPRLISQVYAMCGNRSEAEDVVQEAFERAWQHRDRIDAERAPEAWVRTTAMRLAVSRWRKSRNALTAWTRRGVREEHEHAEPFDPALVAALNALPEAQREAVVLHHLADLSVAQIAQELGVPDGTVKARLSRGRTALATLLAPISEGSHV